MLQPPVATGTGVTHTDESLPASLAPSKSVELSDVKPGPDFFPNRTRGTGATDRGKHSVTLIALFYPCTMNMNL